VPTLNWIGKEAVVNHHRQVPFRLLRDVPSLSCGDPGSGNLIVQGDNLLALKALLPYYAGQVKCIYIDPPYNTGNEGWVYNDSVNSPLINEWLGKVVGKEGETLDRHDRWICMMYPRLSLLKEFLRDDGVIFVSIDDYEINSLIFLLDELYGAGNRIGIFTWQRKKKGSHLDNHLRKMTEFVVCYALRKTRLSSLYGEDAYADKAQPIVKRTNKLKLLEFPPGIVQTSLPDGTYEKGPRGKPGTGLEFKSDFKVVRGVVKSELSVEGRFVWTQGTLSEELRLGTKIDLSKKFGFNAVRHDQLEKYKTPTTLLTPIIGIGTNEDASQQLSEIFNREMGKAFPYSKPVSLIHYLVRSATKDDPDAIVLDSFGGSGTTAHATLQLNNELGGNRRFVLIQMPHETIEQQKNDENITRDITAVRVQKAITGYGITGGEKFSGLGGGFRYCELGDLLFDERGKIRESVRFADLARHVYFTETGEPLPHERVPKTSFLGNCRGVGIYLLYNGILGDKSANGGNILTRKVLAGLPPFAGQKVIYSAGCLIGKERLEAENIIVRQTPYEIKVS
jgi:site-specific DNA-methyltransferase (adenine-specific)/adenine-specific DNA-methyltransferase